MMFELTYGILNKLNSPDNAPVSPSLPWIIGNTLSNCFRNRIMFPIHNSNGEAVGFSGRIYDNISDSKYINTRETYIFKKGEILFNYHRAILEAKKNKYLIQE